MARRGTTQAEAARRAARQARADRVQRRFDPFLIAGALLVLPMLVLAETDIEDTAWEVALGTLNWLIWLTFLAEVVVMLAISPDRRGWLRTHWLDVVITAVTPPVLPAGLQSLRAARLLLLLRLAKVFQSPGRIFSGEGLRVATVATLVTVVAGGVAFSALEPASEGIDSWDGVWWSIVTVTTVGYGDIVPTTTGGRIIGIIVMVVGIGLVALLTAAAAQRFIAAAPQPGPPQPEPEPPDARLDDISHRLDRIERALESLARSRGPE